MASVAQVRILSSSMFFFVVVFFGGCVWIFGVHSLGRTHCTGPWVAVLPTSILSSSCYVVLCRCWPN
ncbi:hypothetical protein BDP81DRAFT_435522 [Colletotrichum phormii]|uniref:Uncharacterized protein n=1 Tax=Colletotrichum phormii TaxID=359342 RepID=A0AAJ0ED67_9PEZI|nr:uncharacterized protein BDP81DRAFT_435522 [Colletotrichum phormii]KAK1625292.1 hypothetical protein BDP81DRAFT_435522 [Colletotrichum phormii]